jgi:hypothetical protein
MPNLRDLQITSGDPNALLDMNRSITGASADNGSPEAVFGQRLTEMLQAHQKMGTAGFVRQGLDASDLQANRVFQTPSNLVGASPGQQNSARSGSVNAVSPTIQGAGNSAQTYGEQLNSFSDILGRAQDFMSTQEKNKQNTIKDARDLIDTAIGIGSDALENLMKAQPDIVKAAGFDAKTLEGFVSSLKKSETKKGSKLSDDAPPSENEVRAFLQKNKKANPGVSFYDLWGQLSDQLQGEGYNPSNYDKQFWEILHPEGLVGYEKYVKKAASNSDNPFN